MYLILVPPVGLEPTLEGCFELESANWPNVANIENLNYVELYTDAETLKELAPNLILIILLSR